MHPKSFPLTLKLTIQSAIVLLFAISWVADSTANESTTVEKNIVGESFKSHGEYINPNGDGYPTAAKMEYVMGCMSANGMELGNLIKCSCSIDYIAAELSYEDYIKADTVLRAQLDQGTKGTVFRESNWAREIVDALQEIQSASTLECF